MISIKNKDQINNIQVAGNIISQIFVILHDFLKPGISTLDIDKFVHNHIILELGKPTFLGYNNFPASCCTSINEEVIHGIPSDKIILKKGDILSVDIGVTFQDCIADSAYTYYIGSDTPQNITKLLKTTKYALQKGIESIKPNNRISDISKSIQEIAKKEKLGIIKDYCGHGVGTKLHEKPEIPNFYPNDSPNPRLREGMVLAIEPMFTLGSHQIAHREDTFTVYTKDKSLAAHFEHTVVVTAEGYKILT